MLPAVTGLHQVSQDASGTVFAWSAVVDADQYAVSVDGTTVTKVSGLTATVTAPAGSHTIGVAPVANPTAATMLAFSVPGGGGGPPPTPNPPAGARIVRIGSVSGDATAAINAAIAQAQAGGVSDAVIDFAQEYDVAGHIAVPRVVGAPRLWLMGNGRGSSGMRSTVVQGPDMFSNQADDTQSIGLDFDCAANQAGHAYSSSGNRAGIWHSSITGGSTSNFAGRITAGYTPSGLLIVHETPRDIIGYTNGQTIVDLIISGLTAGSNALMDFDFNDGLVLWNIVAKGNRFDFYCVGGLFASSTFTPIAAGDPGFELTSGFPPSGPFTIQDWTSSGGGGRILAAPPVGSKGYIAGRMTKDVTLRRVKVTGGGGTEFGDSTGLLVDSCALGPVNIVTQFHLDGTVVNTTNGPVSNGAKAGASVHLPPWVP